MYGWPEHACRGCSFVADQVGHVAHLNARDTTLAFASRAPQQDIDRLKVRMDWKMPWWNWHDAYGEASSKQWSNVVDRGLALQGESVKRSADEI